MILHRITSLYAIAAWAMVLVGLCWAENPPLFPGECIDGGEAPIAIAIGDFNGDLALDLAVGNSTGYVSVLLNDGQGSFASLVEYTVNGNVEAIVSADVNRDGSVDIVVKHGGVSLFLGNGDGTFTGPAFYSGGTGQGAFVVRDLNGDDWPDLALTDNNNVLVRFNDGDGAFGDAVMYPADDEPRGVAAGDLNGDGQPDLAAANFRSHNVSILLNNGAGAFSAPIHYEAGWAPFSLALGDLNGDNALDIVVTPAGNDSLAVLLNDGDASFTTSFTSEIGSEPTSPVVADLDDDGHCDLIATSNYPDGVAVLRNNGDGTFEPMPLLAVGDAQSVAVGDLDQDGRLDLAVASWGPNNVAILRNRGGAVFGPELYGVETGAQQVGIADLDGDHWPDIISLERYSGAVHVFVNERDGTFSSGAQCETSRDCKSFAIGDISGDGYVDAVVAVDGFYGAYIDFLLNDREGGFDAAAQYPTSPGLAWVVTGDLDRNGETDIVVSNASSGEVCVYSNDGHGGLAEPACLDSGAHPQRLAVGDLDGDQWPDLVTVNNVEETVSVFINEGNGAYADGVQFDAGVSPNCLAVGDLNRDGRDDVVVGNTGDSPTFSPGMTILLGQEDGTLTPVAFLETLQRPAAVWVADLSGDRYADIASCPYSRRKVQVFVNNGDLAFAPPQTFSAGDGAKFVVAKDLDQDARLDLVVACEGPDGGGVAVFLNQGGRLPGDVDGDFDVDWDDLSEFVDAYGSHTGDPRYDPSADFNYDGAIDLADLQVLLANFE